MVKTDDGFCCAFNTISVQSSYASEAGKDYDQAEYGDDYDYYDQDYDDEDYYYDYDTTTTESPGEAVTYPGSLIKFFNLVYHFKIGKSQDEKATELRAVT